MNMDSVAVEKLFDELTEIFKENEKIEECDITFLEDETKKSPFLVVENKLGIDVEVSKILSLWSNEEMTKLRKDQEYKYKKGNDHMLHVTRCLLLFVPDHVTAWNIRKEFVTEGFLKVGDDLHFATLISSRNPKSSEIFSHRKWLLQKYLDASSVVRHSHDDNIITMATRPCARCEVVSTEFEVCDKCSSRRFNNQSSWNYRFWLVENISCRPMETSKMELKRNKEYVNLHISDNTAFNYRRNLLIFILCSCSKESEYEDFISMLIEEMVATNDLVEFYKEFESLWCHKRFLIQLVMDASTDVNCLYNARSQFIRLAKEIGPHSKKPNHNHLHHNHYHHRYHYHYNHHQHQREHAQPAAPGRGSKNSFYFPLEFPNELKLELAKDLAEVVEKEIRLFRELNDKHRREYLPYNKLPWFDLVTRRYVTWFRQLLNKIIHI